MVLKDFECAMCGDVVEMYVDGSIEKKFGICVVCDAPTSFISVCNGGTKIRPGGTALEHRDYDGYARVVGFDAEIGENTGKRPETRDGKDLVNKFNDSDRLAEQRDFLKSEKKRKQGKNKMYFGDK